MERQRTFLSPMVAFGLVLAGMIPWPVLMPGAAMAAPPMLAPFKDDLFSYPPLTALSDDGAYVDVDYSEARDIDRRDEVPERRVKPAYVDLSPLSSQVDRSLPTPAGPLNVMSVGQSADPSVIVLFVHGRGGDRRLGMNDRTFGGNFNRLKNLVSRAGGLYATIDAGSFTDADATRLSALVETLGGQYPDASFVLACGSMGGEFCWDVVAKPGTLSVVDGIVMLSANNVAAKVAALRQAAGSRRIPLVLAHGTRDKVFAWDGAKAIYTRLRGEDYPVRFLSFDGGNHGTPIRMIDWRDTLNWMFARMG